MQLWLVYSPESSSPLLANNSLGCGQKFCFACLFFQSYRFFKLPIVFLVMIADIVRVFAIINARQIKLDL